MMRFLGENFLRNDFLEKNVAQTDHETHKKAIIDTFYKRFRALKSGKKRKSKG